MSTETIDLRNGLPYNLQPDVPKLLEIEDQRVVAVPVTGDPSVVSEAVLKPLYAAAYAIRKVCKAQGRPFSVDKLRGRWPDGLLDLPRPEWAGRYGLPIPEDFRRLPELGPDRRPVGVDIRLERWTYGRIGAIVHLGGFESEGATIARLHEFVAASGARVRPDSHEEVYLSDPRRSPPERRRTLILCRLA